VLAAARSWEKSLPPRETLTTQPHVFSLGQARWPCLVLLLAVGLILVGVPVASLAWKVGLAGNPPGWSSLAAVSHLNKVVLTRGRLVGASLLSAATVGAAAALLGLLTCWLARGSRWFHTAVLLLVGAAWALPGPVVGLGLKAAIALLMDLDRSGLAARLLYHGPSPVPVLWADLVRFFPCAVALLWPVVRLLPPELCDAARTDGARPAQELRHVVWPLTAPSVLCAGLAVGVLCLGELSAGKLVATPGSPTYAHEVFTQMHYGVTNDLAALNLILLVTVILGGLVVVVASRIPRLYNGQHQ
jgi:ABC-type Fe3+ transport system permease subunit